MPVAEHAIMASIPQHPTFSPEPEPAWDVALLFPFQGGWHEEDYLALQTNQLVEFADGYVKVLPMPTTSHQFIVEFLYRALSGFAATRNLGKAIFAPLRIRLRPGLIREPDVIYISRDGYHQIGEKYWSGADLVMEVVSADAVSHDRDYIQKRRDYAGAGIAEYWIVDPQLQRITLLSLRDGQYQVAGEFGPGQHATSILIDGFAVDVSAAFAAANFLS
jgi:Uma2 family endonuclease